MQSVRAHSYGSYDVLVYEAVADLRRASGQVLIKVEPVAVNYSGITRRSNTPDETERFRSNLVIVLEKEGF